MTFFGIHLHFIRNGKLNPVVRRRRTNARQYWEYRLKTRYTIHHPAARTLGYFDQIMCEYCLWDLVKDLVYKRNPEDKVIDESEEHILNIDPQFSYHLKLIHSLRTKPVPAKAGSRAFILTYERTLQDAARLQTRSWQYLGSRSEIHRFTTHPG